jgi:hypothetical protein
VSAIKNEEVTILFNRLRESNIYKINRSERVIRKYKDLN